MKDFLMITPARMKALLSSVVLWATVIAAVLGAVGAQLGADNRWGGLAVSAAGILAAAVTALRRVTPVEPDQRGILPKP